MRLRTPHVTAVPAGINTLSEALHMSRTQLPQPLGPNHGVPEEFDPPPQPVDPDEGTIPPSLPADAEPGGRP